MVPRWSAARRLLCLLILSAQIALIGSPAAAQSGDDQPAELGAMTLLPSDARAVGLDGYGLSGGVTGTVAELADFLAIYVSDDGTDTRESLWPSGLQQGGIQLLGLATDSDSFGLSRMIASSVYAYEDAQTAASAFSALLALRATINGDKFEDAAVIGERTLMMRTRGRQAISGARFERLDLVFHTSRYVAGASLLYFLKSNNEPVPAADVHALAEQLLERIEVVSTDGGPGLSTTALRLDPRGVSRVYHVDSYRVRDGYTAWNVGTSEETKDSRRAIYATGEVLNSYVVEQTLEPGAMTEDAADASPYYRSTLYQSGSEDGAAALIPALTETFVTGERFTYQVQEDAPEFGDESLTIAYWSNEPVTDDAYSLIYLIHARIDTTVAVITLVANISSIDDLDAPLESMSAFVETLMQAQLDCVEATACPEAVAVPDALGGLR